MAETVTPEGFAQAAAALAGAAAEHRAVRFVGGATKLGWGNPLPPDALRLSTAALTGTLALRPADRVASFAAGTPLARAQAELAQHGFTVALDPMLAYVNRAATIGGVVATGDSGPRAHSGGRVPAVVLDLTVALSDGQIVHTGAEVLRSASTGMTGLMLGAYGTLGLILAVTVRLEPLAGLTRTVMAVSEAPDALVAASIALGRNPFQLQALDYAWRQGRGGLLARVAGEDADEVADRVGRLLAHSGLTDIRIDRQDELLWQRQRQAQRTAQRVLMRVDATTAQLPQILDLADRCDALSAGRLALGTNYVTMNVNRVAEFRAGLDASVAATALDVPQSVRATIPVWPAVADQRLALMRRLKASFDPAGVCNPGILAGGI